LPFTLYLTANGLNSPRGKKFFSVIMEIELGEHFEENQRKLEALTDSERAWAAAIKKCQNHINIRLKKRMHFGAHAEARLGMEAIDYYVTYAIDAVLEGRWEWKEEFTLSEQLCRIVESVISKEVEKFKTELKSGEMVISVSYDDMDTFLYDHAALPATFNDMDHLILDQKIQEIEDIIKDDDDLVFFWECVKEGHKPIQIAAIMDMKVRQVYKLRDRFIRKIQTSPYFESENYANDKF